jgi:hypothetical protein
MFWFSILLPEWARRLLGAGVLICHQRHVHVVHLFEFPLPLRVVHDASLLQSILVSVPLTSGTLTS